MEFKRSASRAAMLAALSVIVIAALSLAGSFSPERGDTAQASKPLPVATTPIQHVIIFLKENRSFDDYFGKFPNLPPVTVNGVTYPGGATTATKSDGTTVALAQTPDPMPNDIDHSPAGWTMAYNNGAMNGFDKEHGGISSAGDPLSLSQMSESQIPNYWAYAKEYGLGDAMFADWKGASFTNNLFEIAGQAGRYDPHTGFRSVFDLPFSPSHPSLNIWGCDDPPDTLVSMLAIDGSKSSMFPCFSFKAMPNELQQYGLTWGFYTPNQKGTFQHVSVDAINSIRYDPRMWANVKPVKNFYSDVANGTLPAVSWVLADHTEHPPQSSCSGENATVSIVNSIMNSQYWNSTAIFETWDEWGGFYDHVPPPQPDNVSFGFRVPLLVISPWTKIGTPGAASPNQGFVSNTMYSFASFLKFIEVNWSLPALTPSDDGANDMMDLFDFTNPGQPPKPPLTLTPRTCPKLTAAERQIVATEPDD